MAKLTLSDPSSLANEQSFLATIAANNAATETALENTLSRDGTSPNTMTADLDMNSNNILNLPTPATDAEPVTLGYLTTQLEDIEGVGFAFASVTSATPVVGDYLVFGDISDSDATKKATITDVLALASAASDNITSDAALGTDNILVKADGISRKVQATGISVDDSNNVSGVATITTSGNIELGHASDTTISRTGAGAIAVEGIGVALNSTSAVHTASTIELGHASDTTLSRVSAGIIAVEGTQLKKAGKETIWIPASAMIPATTSGPASAQFESTTNDNNFKVLDFDASADEHAHFNISFPKSWDEGTVTFRVKWMSTATDTDGVAWGLQGAAVSDNESTDVTWGTAVVVTDDAQSAAAELYITSESSAVTIGGTPAEGDLCFFRIFRDVSDVNDDMTEDARLIGVEVFFTTNAATDA